VTLRGGAEPEPRTLDVSHSAGAPPQGVVGGVVSEHAAMPSAGTLSLQ